MFKFLLKINYSHFDDLVSTTNNHTSKYYTSKYTHLHPQK